eukprot:TRINITY_DN762_c0_g1_i6.p1 TRINITY_DN762_c0_g1~~TRINITY_DN762_c0_g1_i6.p1  ORF type:complete len:106 (+),score=25.96 TRINITY_DN762_c0_g1_i6:68-385(+)
MNTKILVLLIACLLAIQAFAQEQPKQQICKKNVGCGGCDSSPGRRLCGVRRYYSCGDTYDCAIINGQCTMVGSCLLYTSDAADDLLCVDLGGRRIIKKKKLENEG